MADTQDLELGVSLNPKDIKKTANELQKQIEGVFTATTGKKADVPFKRILDAMSKDVSKSKELRQELSRLENVRIDSKEYVKLQNQLKESMALVDELRIKEQEMANSFSADDMMLLQTDAAYQQILAQLEEAESKTIDIDKAMQQLVADGKAFTLGQDTEEFEKKSQELANLNNHMRVAISQAEQYREVDGEIVRQTQEVAETSQQVEFSQPINSARDLEAVVDTLVGRAEILSQDVEAINMERPKTDADQLNEALGQVGDRARGMNLEVEAVANKINEMVSSGQITEEQAAQLLEKLQGVDTAINQAATDAGVMTSELQNATTQGKSLVESIAMAPKIFKEGFVNIIRGIPQALGKVASAAKDAAGHLYKVNQHLKQMVGSAIKSGLQKMAKTVGNMASKMKDLNHHGGKSGITFSKILKYGFGIRSIYALVNKLRSAIKEGVTNLAQFNGGANQTNTAISSMVSSLNYLKNSFGAAFAPILTVVAPILSQFIDMLAAAVNKIGMFFAALTGAKSFTAAKKTSTNYAASQSGGGGGGSKGKSAEEKYQEAQAKAQAKYEKQLASVEEKRAKAQEKYAEAQEDVNEALGEYDKLSVIATEDAAELQEFEDPEMEQIDPNDFLDAGALGGGIEDAFEEVPIDSIISDWAEKFKEAWANADFYDIGQELGTKLRDALNAIDWAWIQDFAWRLAHSLATFLNGFIETEGLGESIGHTLAQAINTAFIFLNTFLDTFHWDELGKTLGRLLTTAIEEIDWQAIGHFFAQKFNALFDVIGGLAETFDGSKLGDAIATAVNTAISDFNWSKNAESLSNFALDLLDAIKTAVSNVHWSELGDGIADFLNGIDWVNIAKDLGESLSELAKGILDTLIAALENTDWQEMGEGVIEFICAIDWAGLLERWYEVLGAALGALASFLWGIIGDAWQSVVDWWDEAATKDGEEVIAGLLEGIGEALKDIWNWIKEHIFKPIKEGFEKAFKIHSPSKFFKEEGNFLMDGLKNGITEKIQGIVAKFTELKTKILTVLNTLKTSAITIWNNIWSGIKGVINKILGGVERFLNGIIGAINALINALNSIQLDVPDWMTEAIETLAGVHVESIGFNVPTLSYVSVPRLAEGAVIPPNKQFLAMLGDQKSGTNIEAPLDTMVEAFKTALQQEGSSNKEPIVLQLDGRTVAEVVWDEQDKRYRQLGKYIPSYS